MNLKGQVQGFAIGAAVMAGLMLGVPLLSAPASPQNDADELAAVFGMEIVWSASNPCQAESPRAQACYDNATPSNIYMSPAMPTEHLRHAVLHEVGHAIQSRLGQQRDECAADMFANSLGTKRGIYCAIRPN